MGSGIDFLKFWKGRGFIGSLTLLLCEDYKIIGQLWTEFNEFLLYIFQIEIFECELFTTQNIYDFDDSAFTASVYAGLLLKLYSLSWRNHGMPAQTQNAATILKPLVSNLHSNSFIYGATCCWLSCTIPWPCPNYRSADTRPPSPQKWQFRHKRCIMS